MRVTDFGPLGTRYFRWDDESPLPYHAVSMDVRSRVINVESLLGGRLFSFDPDFWRQLRDDRRSRTWFFREFGFCFDHADHIVRWR